MLAGCEVGWGVVVSDAVFVVAKTMSMTRCKEFWIAQWLLIIGLTAVAGITSEVM